MNFKQKISCKLRNSDNGDLIGVVTLPIYCFLVPPHRADVEFNTYTNEEELKDYIKKLLNEQIDNMEIKYVDKD